MMQRRFSHFSRTRSLVVLAAAIGILAAGPSGAEAWNSAFDSDFQPSMMATMAASAALLDTEPTKGSSRNTALISITPRVWLTQVNTTEFDDFDASAIFVPMYGGSIEFTPPWIEGLSIIATGLYGEGQGEAFNATALPGDQDADTELIRTDIELLIRYQIPETQLILFLGPRYVTFDQIFEFRSFDVDELSEIVVLEFGVGAFASISENGNHRFFGNITGGVAYESFSFESEQPGVPDEDGEDVTGTLDINVGYQYLLTGWASLNLRYRMFVFFGQDDFDQSDLTTVHGPEIGVAFRF